MDFLNSIRVMQMFSPLVGKVPTEHLQYLMHRLRNEKPHMFGDQMRLNTFFPPYPSAAFDRFCQTVIDRKRVPLSVYLAVTEACPFLCDHCSYGKRQNKNMTREQLINAVRQIKSLGTSTIGFTGGEPLHCDALEDLIAEADPEMATIVFTTGFGLDKSRAKRLSDAGVTCVTIGIESSNPDEHDAVRGYKGSFDIARSAIEILNQIGIYTAISTIGKREKIRSEELGRMYEMGTQWGVKEFRVIAPVATGSMTGCAASMLSPEEYQALSDFHVHYNRQPGHGPVIASFAYIESDMQFGCGAGYHHLFVDAAGEVCPCDLTPLSFGNLNAEPLSEIWGRMGNHFSKPRCGCLMGKINENTDLGMFDKLPLPPHESLKICPKTGPDDPIPEGYRQLLKH